MRRDDPKPIYKPDFLVTRASHAVLQVRDLAASRAFYVDTLGFVVSADEPGTSPSTPRRRWISTTQWASGGGS